MAMVVVAWEVLAVASAMAWEALAWEALAVASAMAWEALAWECRVWVGVVLAGLSGA